MEKERIKVLALRYAGLPCSPQEQSRNDQTDFYALKNRSYFGYIDGYKQALSDVKVEVEKRVTEGSSKYDISEGAIELDRLLDFICSLEIKEFNPEES